MERTLAIIKPDAVKKAVIGRIIDAIEKSHYNFRIIGLKAMQLTNERVAEFYAEHREKPFFQDLIAFMTEEKIVVLCLEAENAIHNWRLLIGNTNPQKADQGTIRQLFGESIERNIVHGSDGPTAAKREITFFFTDNELQV